MSRPPLRQRLLPFTGLIPVMLMVPVLAFNLYAIAIVLGISGARSSSQAPTGPR